MTQEQRQDQRMLDWLESGPLDVPVEPLEAAVEHARTHPRRRLSSAGMRRFAMDHMQLQHVQPQPKRQWGSTLAAVAAVVVVAVVGVAGLGLIAGNGDDRSGGLVTPTASPTPVATPTPAPTPTAAALVGDPACTVATLAGTAGRLGTADGVGSAARFGGESFGIAIDASGALYVADSGNHVIRRITSDGAVTTLAGKPGEAGEVDGTGSAARFDKPAGIAIDASGTLYVADNGGNTIRKITPDGAVTTLAGKAGEAGITDGTGSDARFYGPAGIAVDAAGYVYVGSLDQTAIRKIAPDGTVTTFAGSRFMGSSDGAGSDAAFTMPWTLALDDQGVLWVVDVGATKATSRLRTVTPDGTVATVEVDWAAAGAGWPGTPWVDPSGVVYLSSFGSGTVFSLDPDGTVTLLAGKVGEEGTVDGPGDVARFTGPLGIVRDAAGVLYVVDPYSATIRTVTCR